MAERSSLNIEKAAFMITMDTRTMRNKKKVTT